MSLHVATGEFEGPLEHLLKLIQEKKMPINDISLASVCDEYVAYIKKLQETHYHSVTYFLVIAATLLLIKSKSLLPSIATSEEEEESMEDLERRLSLYSVFAEQTDMLSDATRVKSSYFQRYQLY